MNVQVKIGDQTFDVEVGDLTARPVLVKIEGETFEVWPEEAAAPDHVVGKVPTAHPAVAPLPRPVAPGIVTPNPAVPAAPESKSRSISAPIPGVIVSVMVKPGDTVTKGQELLNLEAMKMKNAIRATRDGCIAAVLVCVGDHVAKGHPLIEFTD